MYLSVCSQIGSHIKKQVGELGFSCTGLVTKAGALQCSPNDSFTKKELIESARKVSEKVRPTNNHFSSSFQLFLGHFSNSEGGDDRKRGKEEGRGVRDATILSEFKLGLVLFMVGLLTH